MMEVRGQITQMMGSHARVSCEDGNARVCRIRLHKKLRAGDIVLVRPWEVESDKKEDIITFLSKGVLPK